ncbi:hypothetical protein L1F30_15030 [Simiduia sp. 21SJ11W-1]|uniref:hypothetical protein n=1 Tax=Simiduia sp. 21SJ11W-1 TaxID=2909669 RepID=UPI00209F5296|nr:hypothetical protein [Simiduia sp. 21SJ11W-1]UTA47461.1 hypothetical protein L1F30_15030 [Simiduia sp. 21SJ11W-1]
MIPDPTTKEGMEEIQRRIKKRRQEAAEARKRATENPDDEPSGKHTIPSDIDRHKDRKNDD